MILIQNNDSMHNSMRSFLDRLRITIILYCFCERFEGSNPSFYGVFRSEVKIQALDFLLRYPDFLSIELMDLMDGDSSISREEIQSIVEGIYGRNEPEVRVEEMKKFFHGAYESIDDVVAFLISVGFLEYESKVRKDGKTYDKNYFVTFQCADAVRCSLEGIPSVNWYFERCKLIKKYFDHFTGTQLKARQYRYSEYSDVSYRSHIRNIDEKVKRAFFQRFKKELV